MGGGGRRAGLVLAHLSVSVLDKPLQVGVNTVTHMDQPVHPLPQPSCCKRPSSGSLFCARPKTWILFGLCFSIAGCTGSQPLGSGPYTTAAQVNPGLNAEKIEKIYKQGFEKNYIAFSGSQLNQSLFIGSFQRFMRIKRARISAEKLRDNFTGFGYFQEPTVLAIRHLCDPGRAFVAHAGLPGYLGGGVGKSKASCDNGQVVHPVPLGYDAKVFVVDDSNSFATQIDLQQLAKVSRQRGGEVRWSDLNSQWPSRPIHWIFPVQLPFAAHMEKLGIKLPKRFSLATDYTRIYEAAGGNPDALIYTYFSPSLNARLLGSSFRLLSVRAPSAKVAVVPSLKTIGSTYPAVLRSDITLYINPSKNTSCVAMNFAAFLLVFNERLLQEQNMVPLSPALRRQALQQLQPLLYRSSKVHAPFCGSEL